MTIPWLKIALPIAGFALGWLSRPAPPAEVKTVEVVKTEYVDRIVYQDRKVVVMERAQVVRKIIRVVVAPDGTTTREVTVDTNTNERQAAAASSQGARATSTEQSRVSEVTAALRPPWAFLVAGGLNLGAVRGDDRRWWAGAAVTHAFVGSSRLGVAAAVRPQAKEADVGVVAGVEF